MIFKESFKKNKKKFIIASIISAIMGFSIGYLGSPDQESLNDYLSKNQNVLGQIEDSNNKNELVNNELSKLKEEKSSLEDEKKSIEESIKTVKAEAERKEKEEQERIAKEATEREAREEEKRIQENLAKEEVVNKAQANTSSNNNSAIEPASGTMVWQTKTGSKYHSHNSCGKTDSSAARKITLENAKAKGLKPCSKCY